MRQFTFNTVEPIGLIFDNRWNEIGTGFVVNADWPHVIWDSGGSYTITAYPNSSRQFVLTSYETNTSSSIDTTTKQTLTLTTTATSSPRICYTNDHDWFVGIYRNDSSGGDVFGRAFQLNSSNGTLSTGGSSITALYTAGLNVAILDIELVATNKILALGGTGGTGLYLLLVEHDGLGNLSNTTAANSFNISIAYSAAKLVPDPTDSTRGIVISLTRDAGSGINNKLAYIPYTSATTTPTWGSTTTLISTTADLGSVGVLYHDGYLIYVYHKQSRTASGDNKFYINTATVGANWDTVTAVDSVAARNVDIEDNINSHNIILLKETSDLSYYAACDSVNILVLFTVDGTGSIEIIDEVPRLDWASGIKFTNSRLFKYPTANTGHFGLCWVNRNNNKLYMTTGSLKLV